MGYGNLNPHIVRILQKHIVPDSHVLEIGCGVKQYRPWLPTINYKGLDLPDSKYISDPPDYACSAENIPCDDESFDVVFGVATFYLHENVEATFQEVYRVLRPGGILLLFDYQQGVLKGFAKRHSYHVSTWDFSELSNRLVEAGFHGDKVNNICHQLDLYGDPSLLRFTVRRLRRFFLEKSSTWLIAAAHK